MNRTDITCANRIVIKIGSRVLVQRTGRPDLRRMRTLVNQIAALHRQGKDAGDDEAADIRTRPSNGGRGGAIPADGGL